LVTALPAAASGDRVTESSGGRTLAVDGTFRIPGLRPGDWSVQVRAPGYAPLRSPSIRLGPENDGWTGTLTLSPAGSLVLALTLAGQPASGAVVELLTMPPTAPQLWALRSAARAAPKAGQRVVSGPDGRVELGDIAPGEVWVAVFAAGSPPRQAGPFRIESGASAGPVALELERGGRLHGRLNDKDGRPVSTAQVRITERGAKIGFPLTVVTDAEGRWASDWIPAGRYALEAFFPGDPARHAGPVEVDVLAGEESASNLTL
jgi:hypothetical protein